jgi:ribosome-associated heat shock protein Hsp15
MNSAAPPDEVRLDKWLWAARFFKTRRLAVEAIAGGKVQVNGQRAKPGHGIRAGTRLSIHKDTFTWDLDVLAVSNQRRPASEAALLYREDESSVLRRQDLLRRRREAGPVDTTGERPTKRDRRQIQRFTSAD